MRSLLWNYQFLCLLLLFYIYAEATTSSSFTSSTPGKICSHNEAAALLQFKQSFLINSSASFTCDADYGIRSYPKTDSWEESTDCCSWDGVTCDSETGQVIGLDLSCSRLYGTIPSNSSIFLLQHLKRLDLSFNDFRNSKISAGFGRFGDLTHLNLSNSLFSGQVPSDISRLSKLISLDLSSFKPLIPDDSQLKLETTALERLVQNLGEGKKPDTRKGQARGLPSSLAISRSSSAKSCLLLYKSFSIWKRLQRLPENLLTRHFTSQTFLILVLIGTPSQFSLHSVTWV